MECRNGECGRLVQYRATQRGHVEKLAELFRLRLSEQPKDIVAIALCSPHPDKIHADAYEALNLLIAQGIAEVVEGGLFRATRDELVHRYKELIRYRMTRHGATEGELLGLPIEDSGPSEAQMAIHQLMREGELEEAD